MGALGYLCLEDDESVPGNMGARDQVAALRWVRESVRHFGGDPDRVTVFGESAGGVSVMDLVLAPEAEGLFSAAIAQSGPGMLMPFMRDAKTPGAKEKFGKLAKFWEIDSILEISKIREMCLLFMPNMHLCI